MTETVTSPRRLPPATIALAVAALIAIGVLVYTTAFRGRGTAVAETNTVSANSAADQVASVDEMIGGLVEQVRRNPDDHDGWFRLGLAYKGLEDLPRSIQALRRAMELQPRNADYLGFLGEALLIQSTRSSQPAPPEAELLFRRALEVQPGYPRSRFYLATLKDLRGDHRGAVDDLIALLNDPQLDRGQTEQVRSAVQVIAQAASIDLGGRLPPLSSAPAAAPAQSAATAAIPGPTPDQMRAASGMTPSQQGQMGRDMVERLAGRLRQNPRDADRWMMMMRSRMVLNEPQLAAEALRSSLAAFRDDPATQARLRQAARELNVPGA